MRPRITSLDDRPGVEIVDPIESHRYALYTPEPVSPMPADTERFVYPVTVARKLVTSRITLPTKPLVMVRDAHDGTHICNIDDDGDWEFEADEYLLNVGTPVKIYLRITSSFSVSVAENRHRFDFGSETPVEVGVRSIHTSPIATVTVPDNPRAAMRAVSTFGSTVKTTTPERSWPSLRGHPPRIERGDELSIPDALDVPETGITIHVPEEYRYVLPVAPLAYYLGATVVPGETPRLTTENGFSHSLGDGDDFDDEVARVLKQVLVLDCVTRTEGFHQTDLAEHRAVESFVDLDTESLYNAPLAERLRTYLSLPETVADEVKPTWGRVVYTRPVAESMEVLPYVANDLSIIRTKSRPTPDSPPGPKPQKNDELEALNSFKRNSASAEVDLPYDTDDRATGVPDFGEYVPLPETEAMERAWVGDGTPVHGTKLHPAAFHHERTESTDGVIEVTVVCNDEEMREEWDTVSEVYGNRDVVPFEVDCRFGVSTDELRTLLSEDHDLFHFIGHVDGRGLQCPDGLLDAETLPKTGATTVLLNACRSHDQGIALLEAGARAAIVSWGDVGNLGALEVGETFARLLNYGFGVGGALEVVDEYTSIGHHYVVVGDPNVTVAQCKDGTPTITTLEFDSEGRPDSDELVKTRLVSCASPDLSHGTVFTPYFRNEESPESFVAPASVQSTHQLREVDAKIGDDFAPLVVNGTLRWTDQWFHDDDSEE